MTARSVLQRWASTTTPARQAAELLRTSTGSRSLKTALVNIVRQIQDAQFLVVKLHDEDLPALGRAIESFSATGSSVRLCLAGDRRLLSKVDASGLDSDHFGLMIDDVSFDTTWADLVWDRIEAVRFRPSFVARAVCDMRAACALESMLGLVREMGLRTLGSHEAADCASVSGHYEFDYLPLPRGPGATFKVSGDARHVVQVGAAATAGR